MSFETVNLTPRIGSQVKAPLATLLDGSIAGELRALLEQRGVLLFRGLDMNDEQQLQFGKTLGEPRHEHGTDITKVSSDKTKSPMMQARDAWREMRSLTTELDRQTGIARPKSVSRGKIAP